LCDCPETCPQYNDNNKKPLKIAYIGSLSLNRWKTLKFLGDVLSSSIYKDDYVIEIYAREVPNSKILKAISKPPYISYCGSLDAEGVINKQKEADILLVAESFNYNCRKNTLLSLSTKITEYMSTGKAILAIGPPEIGSMRFLEENGKAICITKLDKKATANALELLLDDTYRIRVGESNWNCINQIMKNNDMGSTFIKLTSRLYKGDNK
jgi:hypothetical protein